MGRKLDALLGRNFKTTKFKTLSKLAMSRTSILLNYHQTRVSQARSDVKKLLLLGHQDRAMLRVEHVIKEQNMIDVLSMVEFYCHLLSERVKLLAQNNECPEELKEAASSLIYAASRCGDFPELQKIREVLTSRFGRDFAARSVELRNNCRVNSKMIQKFSTRRPSFENRAKIINEIALECGLTIHLEEDAPLSNQPEVNQKQEETETSIPVNPDDNALAHYTPLFGSIKDIEKFSASMKVRRRYTDVAAAAQDAFESAAHAAEAAKAAVELSMSMSMEKSGHEDNEDSDDHLVSSESKTLLITNFEECEDTEQLEKIDPIKDRSSGTEVEEGVASDSCDNPREEDEAEKETESLSNKVSGLSLESGDTVNRLSNASRDDDVADSDSGSFSFKSAK